MMLKPGTNPGIPRLHNFAATCCAESDKQVKRELEGCPMRSRALPCLAWVKIRRR